MPNPPAQTTSNPTRKTWTSVELINWTKDFFAIKNIASPRREAELLLADVLGCSRVQLYTDFEHPIEPEPLARFRAHVKRRVETRAPIQYILGHCAFMGLELKVSPAVLIPRPETEELCAWGLGVLKAQAAESFKVLDLGAGSGCIAIAIATHETRAHVTGVECSPEALALARENFEKHGLNEQGALLLGDLFAPLPLEPKPAFDLILSNPPYISPILRNTLPPEVRDHEPTEALFAENHGLEVILRIIDEAPAWLRENGHIGIEISPEQADEVVRRFEGTGQYKDIAIRKDLNRHDRFATAQRA